MAGKHKKAIFSVIAGMFILAAVAAADTLLVGQDTPSQLFLFGVSFRDLCSWSLSIAGLFIFGILISKIVSERNLALEAIRDSEEALRTIADAAENATVLMDDQGNISLWNPAAEKLFGYAAIETIGKGLHTLLIPERDHQAFERGFNAFKERAESAAAGRTIELIVARKDGTEFPVEISLSVVRLRGKWHALGMLSEMSERKKSDELRTHSELLEQLVERRTKEFKYVNEHLKKEVLYRQRTEEELRQSEHFLGTIFDSIHDSFSIIDRDYKIIKFNDAL